MGASLLLIVGAGLAVRRLTPAGAAVTPPSASAPAVSAAFDGGLGVDGVYQLLVARPVTALARLVSCSTATSSTPTCAAPPSPPVGPGSARSAAHPPALAGLVWVLCGVLAVGLVGVGLW